MNYLYIGYAVDRQLEKDLTGVSIAGNKMQVNFLKQLMMRIGGSLDCITIYPVAAYPKYRRIFINDKTVPVCSANVDGKEQELKAVVPYLLNLPIVKNLFEIVSTHIASSRLFKQRHYDKVIIFNAFPPTAFAALKLRKKFKCEVICLLADLPIDDSVKTKGLKRILRQMMDNYTRKAIKKMDKIIVLNKEAALRYAPGVPYLVMEGAVDEKDVAPFAYVSPERKNIVYTGALQKYNGIVELIDAFKSIIGNNIELDIYGRGEYVDFVKEACKRDHRIHYYGIKTNKEILKIQREACLLINPRPVDDFIAQVTFPSKIFEYMTSGTPVLTTRLNGFSPEYYDKMFFMENNDPKDIANGIYSVLRKSDDELKEIASDAFAFVIECKNWGIQTDRILSFIIM